MLSVKLRGEIVCRYIPSMPWWLNVDSSTIFLIVEQYDMIGIFHPKCV